MLELLKKSESNTLEFKASFGREVVETLTAFANAKGGTVVIGVKDNKTVTGTELGAETVQKWINQVKSTTSPQIIPDVEVFNKDGNNLVFLSVLEYPVKPVSCRGRYFIRKGNANHAMDLGEIANEHFKTINLSWDYSIDPRHSVDDISEEKVRNFVELANRLREFPITDDPLTVLRKFELMQGGKITL